MKYLNFLCFSSRVPFFVCAFRYFFQALSLETTSASTVAFICSLAVVVVPLINLVVPRKASGDGAAAAEEAWYVPLLPALLAAAGVGSLELGGTDVPGMGDLLALGQVRGFSIFNSRYLVTFTPGKEETKLTTA